MVRLAYISYNGQSKLAAQLLDTKSKETTKENKEEDNNDGVDNVIGYCDLSSIANNVRDFLNGGVMALQYAHELIKSCTADNSSSSLWIGINECELLSPLNSTTSSKLICIGMNYVDHCTEQNIPVPQTPLLFNKFTSSIIGPNDNIVYDNRITTQLDYEVELAIVIGKSVPTAIDGNSNNPPLTEEDAMQYIGGYTIMHDVSARDLQFGDSNGGQWLLGKTSHSFAPIGPVIVTSDELTIDQIQSEKPGTGGLGIRCIVNGEILQNSTTSYLVHNVGQLICHISKYNIALQPGDIIATGTPPGVGCFRKPPKWLKPGDIVQCQIDTIGTLSNTVVDVSTYQKQKEKQQKQLSVSSSSPLPCVKRVLDGNNCIVTGGAQGLGYGIACKFGYEGATHVTIIDINESKINDAINKLNILNPSCTYHGILCDVTDLKQVQDAFKQVANYKNGGTIDVLVQAAGIVGNTNIKCANVDESNFQKVMNINVTGIFHGCKTVLPYMMANNNKYGRIVNIASIAGKEGNAGMLAYSTSKAAVIGLTKTIGKEYAAENTNITCNALAPAVVKTQMVADMPIEQVNYMTSKIPMKRCGTIDEIANLVVFMSSKESSFTTGFCFDATGGRAVY